MNKPTPLLAAELKKLRRLIGVIEADQSNGYYGFRGIKQVMNVFAPAMLKVDLTFEPSFTILHYIPGPKKTAVVECCIRVIGPDGFITVNGLGEGMDSGDKAVTKAQSVAYRSALLFGNNVPSDEMEDSEETYAPQNEQPAKAESANTNVAGINPALNPVIAGIRSELSAATCRADINDIAIKYSTPAKTSGPEVYAEALALIRRAEKHYYSQGQS